MNNNFRIDYWIKSKVQDLKAHICRYILYKNNVDDLSLAPNDVKDEPSIKVVDALTKAVRSKDIHNIALSGSYGAGKSSIIKSFVNQKFGDIQILEVSLATLNHPDKIYNEVDTNEVDTNDISEIIKLNTIKKEDEEEQSKRLEYAILQQIIYREQRTRTPLSRFKRISHTNKITNLSHYLQFIVFICCVIIVFEPSWLSIPSFVDHFTVTNPFVKFCIDIVCVLFIIFWLFVCFKYVINSIRNSSIKAFNIKSGSVELTDTDSVFNKHLDEIMYFFEANPKYNVVVFEDLDRFGNTDIFLKLRELNYILNKSECIKQPLTFIYALKDNIISNGHERAKFFDKIIPVVPYINTSNAASKLYELINPTEGKQTEENAINQADHTINVSQNVCYALGSFLDDMRLLKNIAFEFNIYKDVIGNQVEIGKAEDIDYAEKVRARNAKFLALIVYKNYFPSDFAELQRHKGNLYKLITAVEKYRTDYIAEKQKEIKQINGGIANYEQAVIRKVENLRTLYLHHYQLSQNSRYVINSSETTFDEIISKEDLFNEVVSNNLHYRQNGYSSTSSFGQRFSDIEKKVDPNNTYRTLEKFCQTDYADKERRKIDEINNEITQTNALSLSELCSRFELAEFKDMDKLVKYLLTSGLIDQSYYLYVSHFHPGQVTKNDMAFIQTILTKSPVAPSYNIDNPKETINHLLKTGYMGVGLLNFSLINYLYSNKSTKDLGALYASAKQQIVEAKMYRFIFRYSEAKNGVFKPDLIRDIFKNWNIETFREYLNDSVDSYSKHIEMALKYDVSQLLPVEDEDVHKYLCENFQVVSNVYNTSNNKRLNHYIHKANIRFKTINNSNKDLYSTVLDGFYYDLTKENILTILDGNKDFDSFPYTCIINSGNNKLIEYVDANLEFCINNIFAQSKLTESPDSIVRIINKEYNVLTEDFKVDYLRKQSHKQSSIKGIIPDYYHLLFDNDFIQPYWENIYAYIRSVEVDSDIIAFISRNQKRLEECYDEGSETQVQELFDIFIGSNVIEDDNLYRVLCSKFEASIEANQIADLDIGKIDYLISIDKITYDAESITSITTHHPQLLGKFLVQNIKNYAAAADAITINSSVLFEILSSSSSKVDLNSKLAVIRKVDQSLLYSEHNIANLVTRILCSSKEQIIKQSVLLSVLYAGNDNDAKLSLICHVLKLDSTFDSEFVDNVLLNLGGEYEKIPNREHSAKLNLNNHNSFLASYLWNNKYSHISSEPKFDKGFIKIYLKRS